MNKESHNHGIMKYLIREDQKERFFHSSGYAREAKQAVASGVDGASSRRASDTFAGRQELEKQRQFVRKYNNARVISDARAFDRVRGTVLTGTKPTGTRARLAREVGANRGGPAGTSGARGPATPPARRNPGLSHVL